MRILPATAVVATRNRAHTLRQTLASLERQHVLPAEMIVVDASDDSMTRDVLGEFSLRVRESCLVTWMAADITGAAAQRNQGLVAATHTSILFLDDDILFEPECVIRLWNVLQSDSRLGGVNAMIVNQRYQPPGRVSRALFTLLHGHREASFAGRVIGPAVNLLPEDRDDLPEVVPVEWLNTTCTLYRRDALPSPPFDAVFSGYSMMEDLTLSLRVAARWRLANARTARIFHDSHRGARKADVSAMAAMEVVNRHYVMTEVLGRRGVADYGRLLLWEAFQLAACAALSQTRPTLKAEWQGKVRGLRQIRTARLQRARLDA